MKTSADDTAKAVMRGYADSLQPPPVEHVLARAERPAHTPQSPSDGGRRLPGRLVLASASVAVGAAVFAGVMHWTATPGPTDATMPAATQTAARTGARGFAPGCPPALPLLDGPHDLEGRLAKPLVAQAGQQLTIPAQIPQASGRPRLNSFLIYLVPSGTLQNERGNALAESPNLQLNPNQQRVAPVLQLPDRLPRGSYDIVGYATWRGPAVCGAPPQPDSPNLGTTQGVLGSLVIT